MWRRRARLPNDPEVFDDCSYAGRRLFRIDRAIIRELNETVFAVDFFETGGIGYSGSCGKVVCSMLSTDLSSPALYRLHSVHSDFRPTSGTESGEAALRRLLAIRAVGGYALTSDDDVPGSLTLFQSSRVARPKDASKAPNLVSSLSSLARSYLDTYKQRMLRLVSGVADVEAQLGPACRYVDPVFQHSSTAGVTSWVSFVTSLPRRLGLRGSSLYSCKQPACLNASIWSAAHRGGTLHVEFQGAPEDAQNWFVGSADMKNAFHRMRIPRGLQAFFCTARCSRSDDGCQLFFSWAMFFFQHVTDHCTLTGSAC